MGFVKAYILGMVNKKNVLSLTARSDHSSQLSYPLNGCSPAEPFYVSLNNTKLNILTQFILHSPSSLIQAGLCSSGDDSR